MTVERAYREANEFIADMLGRGIEDINDPALAYHLARLLLYPSTWMCRCSEPENPRSVAACGRCGVERPTRGL